MILMRINHPDSGRIIETAIQQFSPEYFGILNHLVNRDPDEISRNITIEMVMRLAQKMNVLTEMDEHSIHEAAINLHALIRYEDLRRRGHIEYLWPNDIFTNQPSDPGFIRLTELGKEIYYKQVLDSYISPKGTVH